MKNFNLQIVKFNYMKHIHFLIFLLSFITLMILSCGDKVRNKSNEQNVNKKVDVSLFLSENIDFKIETVDCTLSDGTKTKCYQINTLGIPTDHEMGPWCPEHTNDGAEKGGIWFKDGKVYNVDGKFIKDLPTLYHDDHWHLYDDEGNVRKTVTKEDCIKLANAQLVEEFKNYCIECLPEYVSKLSKKILIPVSPIKLETPISLGPPKGEKPSGEKPKGPPSGGGGGKKGPVARGIAFNGVVFDAPAPLHLILGGYTIPPLDHAGGHINLDAGYHYHAATGVTKKIQQDDGHAPMIGYAMDGFGLYARLNSDGKEPLDLDDCRGHYDETRGYHYHVDAAGNNNFINCFSGAIAQ